MKLKKKTEKRLNEKAKTKKKKARHYSNEQCFNEGFSKIPS